MRSLKFRYSKNYYGSFPANTVTLGYTAEQYNRLWYTQWYSEWWNSRSKRVRLLKTTNKVCIYDFNSIVHGRVVGYQRQAKPGKKKRVYKSNSFTIGFVKGMTKVLINAALKKPDGSTLRVGPYGTAQVLMSTQREKKKITKRVSATKKKQDKLVKLKKKKEAVKNKSSELKRMRDQKVKNLKKAQK